MSYQDNLQAKRQAQLEKIQANKKAAEVKKEEDRETKNLTNPNFSMHKLKRAVISYDQIQYCLPMHSYKLSWSTLVHSHKNERGWTVHINCTDLYRMGSCEFCKMTGYQYEPKEIRMGIFYVFNTIGEKRSFEKEENGVNKTITYFLNPAQVVEISEEGSGKDVVKYLDNMDKEGLFVKKTWQILLKKGTAKQDAAGKTRYTGRGFDLPESISEEDLVARIGKEGFEPGLPEYAKNWSMMINEIQATKGEEAARQEVFRYMITSFDNAAEVAELTGMELPQKPERQETKKGLFN